MQGIEINLQQMLNRREQRAIQQQEFLKKYSCPLVSFSMNIPGPIKTNEQILKAFTLGKTELLEKLKPFEILNSLEIYESTGDELLLAVDADAVNLKNIAVQIENNSPVGRLFDIDIINFDGKKLSRENFRKCLICDKQAQECARSRTHSVSEMQIAVEKLLSGL